MVDDTCSSSNIPVSFSRNKFICGCIRSNDKPLGGIQIPGLRKSHHNVDCVDIVVVVAAVAAAATTNWVGHPLFPNSNLVLLR